MSGDNGEQRQERRTLSRIGRKPIPVPSGVQIEVLEGGVAVKGPRGSLTQNYHPEVKVTVENGNVIVERLSDSKFHHSLHGLTRSLIANAVTGVTDGYTKTLELMGRGRHSPQCGLQPPGGDSSSRRRDHGGGGQQPGSRPWDRQATGGQLGGPGAAGTAPQCIQRERNTLRRRSPALQARQGGGPQGLAGYKLIAKTRTRRIR